MDFGKLSNVDQVLFELPSQDPRVASLLNAKLRSPALQVYVGGPLWTCTGWIGKVYPKKIAPRDYLRLYAQQFNSIELNSTFYRTPDEAQVKAWKEAVPRDFKFTPKLHQSISHFGSLSTVKTNLHYFWKNILGFSENLGICFLQLLPHFSFQYWGNLQQFLREIPDPRFLAIEFRHSSWFSQQKLRNEAYDFLRELGISIVITDVAGRRDVLHSSLTTRKVLIRFVGNELHPTDYSRIDSWIERIREWIEGGIEEVYFFIHQPTENEVPDLSKIFVNDLNQRAGLSIRNWTPTQEATPVKDSQLSFF